MNTETLVQELQKLTDFSPQDLRDMVSHGYSLSVPEMQEWLYQLLGTSPAVVQFVEQWVEKRKPKEISGVWKSKDPLRWLQERLEAFQPEEQKTIVQQAIQMSNQERKEYLESLLGEVPTHFLLQFQKYVEKETTKQANQEYKKKPKTKQRKPKKIPDRVGTWVRDGRKVCECQATIHELVTNCLECGKIQCEWEGKEQCTWCGELLRYHTQNS
jgi:hypothetical protein